MGKEASIYGGYVLSCICCGNEKYGFLNSTPFFLPLFCLS